MIGISNTFLVHVPNWYDELRVWGKTNKITLNVSKFNTFGENVNSETVSLPVRGLEIFCRRDMKKNLIKGRLIKRLRNVVNPNHVSLFSQHFKFVNIGYEMNLHFIPCFSNRVVWALVRGYMTLEFRSLLQKWDQSDVDPQKFKRFTRTF